MKTQEYKTLFLASLKKAIKFSLWMTKIMLPVTFTIILLEYFSLLQILSEKLSFLMSYIGLSGDSIFVIVTSICVNIYAAIAVMGVLDLDPRSVAILAVFSLIAHNLIIESIIQQKTGMSFIRMFVIRVLGAILAAYLLNLVIPLEVDFKVYIEKGTTGKATDLLSLLYLWVWDSIYLLVRIFAIVLLLNIVQNLFKLWGVIDFLTKLFAPLMLFLGLSKNASFLWIVVNFVGLGYGGAILIEERKSGAIAERDSDLLNYHASMSHSLFEDTLLFFVLGVPLFWLIIPRLIFAFILVWAIRGVYFFRDKRLNRTL